LAADTALFSAIATGSAVAATAAESLCRAVADPVRANGRRRRDGRSPLRAGLFAPPLSTFAALFACLLICRLAIVVFLWIRIAPVAMLALPQARRSGPGGAATQEGPSTWTAMLPMPRKSSAMCARQ